MAKRRRYNTELRRVRITPAQALTLRRLAQMLHALADELLALTERIGW